MESADQEAWRVIHTGACTLHGSLGDKAEPKQCSNPPPDARIRDVSHWVLGHEPGEINLSAGTYSRNLFLRRLAPFGGCVRLLPQWRVFLESGIAIGVFKWEWFWRRGKIKDYI